MWTPTGSVPEPQVKSRSSSPVLCDLGLTFSAAKASKRAGESSEVPAALWATRLPSESRLEWVSLPGGKCWPHEAPATASRSQEWGCQSRTGFPRKPRET